MSTRCNLCSHYQAAKTTAITTTSTKASPARHCLAAIHRCLSRHGSSWALCPPDSLKPGARRTSPVLSDPELHHPALPGLLPVGPGLSGSPQLCKEGLGAGPRLTVG